MSHHDPQTSPSDTHGPVRSNWPVRDLSPARGVLFLFFGVSLLLVVAILSIGKVADRNDREALSEEVAGIVVAIEQGVEVAAFDYPDDLISTGDGTVTADGHRLVGVRLREGDRIESYTRDGSHYEFCLTSEHGFYADYDSADFTNADIGEGDCPA